MIRHIATIPSAVPSRVPGQVPSIVPGSASGPVLLARTIYPDATGKLVLPTEARTTDLYAADHEGVYRLFESGEPAVVGGRVVRNLVPSADVSDDTEWANNTDITVTSGISDKDGGASAYTLTATGNNGNRFDSIVTTGSGTRKYISSCWIRRRTGTGTVEFLGLVAGYTNITANVTTDWKRFSLSASSNAGTYYIGWRLGTSGDEIDVCFPQAEDATGRSDTTTPSEYVSSDVGLAVYSTENGNSVASNVVTEAVGSALSLAPYVLTTPGATNSCAYSQDFSQTGWSAINASRAADLVDIFGNTNSAQTLTDTSAASPGRYFYDASISSSANEHSARFWISYDASPSSYPALDITIFLGGTPVTVRYIIDPSDGSSVGSGSATRKISVTRDGDFWRCTVSLTDNDSGNTVMRVSIYPSYSADGSTQDSSLTGSCGADQCEIFLNTAHAVAHALPPIPTSGSAGLTDPTEVSIDWPSGLPNNFVVVATTVREPSAIGSKRIYMIGETANNSYVDFTYQSGNTRVRVAYFDGSLTAAANINPGVSEGAEMELRLRKSALNGLDGWAENTKNSSGASDSADDLVAPSQVWIGSPSAFFDVAFVQRVRNVQIWSVPAGISDAAVLALEA